MTSFIDSPFAVLLVTLIALSGAAFIGDRPIRRLRPIKKDEKVDFDTALAATLTLLGLLIGFSFSMAVNRYDQRKNCEEAEASAIGTEYRRADLLPTNEAARVRKLLGNYINQRINFYLERQIGDADVDFAKLQDELWSVVALAANTQPNPTTALAVSGMNDVLNSQGCTQAAWLNRIPGAAWALLGLTAIFANFLMGYRERSAGMVALLVLPIVISIAFFLLADIDSPSGGGIIHIAPHNLISVSQSMAKH
ncbi:MAG TPA: hypothetical protein VGJ20_40840 [Xanthobacteraceae bacterium]|jgi:hypothetical protein